MPGKQIEIYFFVPRHVKIIGMSSDGCIIDAHRTSTRLMTGIDAGPTCDLDAMINRPIKICISQ